MTIIVWTRHAFRHFQLFSMRVKTMLCVSLSIIRQLNVFRSLRHTHVFRNFVIGERNSRIIALHIVQIILIYIYISYNYNVISQGKCHRRASQLTNNSGQRGNAAKTKGDLVFRNENCDLSRCLHV